MAHVREHRIALFGKPQRRHRAAEARADDRNVVVELVRRRVFSYLTPGMRRSARSPVVMMRA